MSTVEMALTCVNESEKSYAKYISPNDAGLTGSHQTGLYLAKESWEMFLEKPASKGVNIEKTVIIEWYGFGRTESHFKYYGKKTRNEYRLTNFGKSFPFLKDRYVGSLFVLSRTSENSYQAYVIEDQDDIDSFMNSVGLPITASNVLIETKSVDKNKEKEYEKYFESIGGMFPDTKNMSAFARSLTGNNKSDCDSLLLSWVTNEYEVFRYIENRIYSTQRRNDPVCIDDFLMLAQTYLQRRKARAGKSLENHVSALLDMNDIPHDNQVCTEGDKSADFILPGSKQYKDLQYPQDLLVFLGAKTTCKDRWRQILTEANRIRVKHLITLQQGISENQMKEIKEANVVLIVPEKYHKDYPETSRNDLLKVQYAIDKWKSINF